MIAAAWAALRGSKIWLYLAFAAAFAWGLLLLVGRLMGAGAAKERAAQAERNAQARRTADEAERIVDRAGDGELDSLRRKWTRGR